MRSIVRAVPAVWEIADPDDVVEARFEAAAELFGPVVESLGDSIVDQLTSKLQRACETLELGGRPLYAAHASLSEPKSRGAMLWHTITLLRENRGDGHIAALATEGVSGIEANIIHIASGRIPKEFITNTRGFSDEEWSSAISTLSERGLLSEDEGLTAAGEDLKTRVEDATDRLSSLPVLALGSDVSDVIEKLNQVTKIIKESNKLPI